MTLRGALPAAGPGTRRARPWFGARIQLPADEAPRDENADEDIENSVEIDRVGICRRTTM